MNQPWLRVPLNDYEGHMGAFGVNQLAPLSVLFGEVLTFCKPASVAIIGIAGGNGLDRIDPQIHKRVVGIDINPDYLAAVRKRWPDQDWLELHHMDISKAPNLSPVDLVHAALLFEHTGLHPSLENCLSLLAPKGHFATVLQLPSMLQEGVAPSGFSSMQNLKEHFSLIDSPQFTGAVRSRGFALVLERKLPLPGGKAFWLGIFCAKKSLAMPRPTAQPTLFA
jgi:trans-aconitate methyltransferase